MKQNILLAARHSYKVPEWLAKVPEGIFPAGPKQLYTYLLVFGREGCWQYNCRLADKFKVTERCIRMWISWLKLKKLIYITQPYNRKRRLRAYNYNEEMEWFTARIGSRAKDDLKKSFMPQQTFEDRRQQQLQLLLGSSWKQRLARLDPKPIGGGLPILPEDMPYDPEQTF